MRIRTDNELDTKMIRKFAENNGINFEFTLPGRSSENGRAERKNRTVMEGIRTILSGAGIGKGHWAFALLHYVQKMNNIARNGKEKTPAQQMGERELSNDMLFLPFGVIGYGKLTGKYVRKLESRCVKERYFYMF